MKNPLGRRTCSRLSGEPEAHPKNPMHFSLCYKNQLRFYSGPSGDASGARSPQWFLVATSPSKYLRKYFSDWITEEITPPYTQRGSNL